MITWSLHGPFLGGYISSQKLVILGRSSRGKRAQVDFQRVHPCRTALLCRGAMSATSLNAGACEIILHVVPTEQDILAAGAAGATQQATHVSKPNAKVALNIPFIGSCQSVRPVRAPLCKRPIHVAIQRPIRMVQTRQPRINHPSSNRTRILTGQEESKHEQTEESTQEGACGPLVKKQRTFTSADSTEAGAPFPLPELEPILLGMCRELVRSPTQHTVEG